MDFIVPLTREPVMNVNGFSLPKILLVPFFVVCVLSSDAQTYTNYHNCSLSGALNKEIESIHFDRLDLPDTIQHSDGRQVVYAYHVVEVKLEGKVVPSDDDAQVSDEFLPGSVHLPVRLPAGDTMKLNYQKITHI